MAIYKNTPPIVTSGLLLHLDAGNKNSYAGSGSLVWNDLSGNKNSGSLVNSPTYTTNNGGALVFNGTNNYISTNYDLSWNNTNSVTINFWVKTGLLSQNGGIIGKPSPDWEWVFLQGSYQTSNSNLLFTNWNTAGVTNIYFGIENFFDTLNWTNCTFAYDNISNVAYIYKNGIFQNNSSYTNPSANQNRTNGISIGRAYAWGDKYFSGSISQLQIYNRALSSTEVLQNYNTMKGRYI